MLYFACSPQQHAPTPALEIVAASVFFLREEKRMPGGDKSKYTEKQKRQAEQIEEGYEERGVPEEERALASLDRALEEAAR